MMLFAFLPKRQEYPVYLVNPVTSICLSYTSRELCHKGHPVLLTEQLYELAS
jgi:hypothetical protein